VVDPLDAPLLGSTTIHGPKAKIRRRSTGAVSGRHFLLTIPVDSGIIWMWDWCHWKLYEIVFPTICGSSKSDSVCGMGVQSKADCSWTPRWTRSRLGLGLHLDVHSLAGPPRLQTHLHASSGPLLDS
jgi:hypothetical protein